MVIPGHRPYRAGLGLALLAAVGCARTSERPLEIAFMDSRLATQLVFLPGEPCPISGKPEAPRGISPIIGAVLGFAVPVLSSAAVNALLEYLKSQQEELSATYAGRGTGIIIGDDGTASGCLVLARGFFGSASPDWGPAPGSLNEEKLKRVGLAGWPDLYIEMVVTGKDDVVTLEPVLLHYAATAAESTRGDSKALAIVLALTTAPVKSTDGKLDPASSAFAEATMFAEQIRIGSEINDPIALRDWAVAIPFPQSARGKPINLHAFVTESEDPSLLSKLALSQLEANKDKLAKALQDILTELAPKEPKP